MPVSTQHLVLVLIVHWDVDRLGERLWRWLKRTNLVVRDLQRSIYSACQKTGAEVSRSHIFSHRRLCSLADRALLWSKVQKLKLGKLKLVIWHNAYWHTSKGNQPLEQCTKAVWESPPLANVTSCSVACSDSSRNKSGLGLYLVARLDNHKGIWRPLSPNNDGKELWKRNHHYSCWLCSYLQARTESHCSLSVTPHWEQKLEHGHFSWW